MAHFAANVKRDFVTATDDAAKWTQEHPKTFLWVTFLLFLNYVFDLVGIFG